MAWIELHQELREHKKLFACADELGISRIEMLGRLVCIWLWALDNAQSGNLSGISNKTIARICDWPEKKADRLVNALTDTGWLDKDGDSLLIHDWLEYAGKLMERREKDRIRKQKGKETKGNSCGIPAEQQRNSCATVQYRTVPYSTVPYLYCGGDGGEYAREATADELQSIGLTPGVYYGVTGEIVRQVQALTPSLITQREPCAADYRNVFMRLIIADGAATKDSCELLQYAFETAEAAGHKGEWSYVNGVLDKLAGRGISTVKEAIVFDGARPDKEVGA